MIILSVHCFVGAHFFIKIYVAAISSFTLLLSFNGDEITPHNSIQLDENGLSVYFNCWRQTSGVNCRYEQELQQLIDSKSGTLITRSATFKTREGNSVPRYAHLGNAIGSISSKDLPNQAYAYYLDFAKKSNYQNEARK
jgi:hypothetical protein